MISELEKNRRIVIKKIVKIFPGFENVSDFVKTLKAVFPPTKFLSSSGCFREVYSLPHQLVIKISTSSTHRHNRTEYLSSRRSSLVAKTYAIARNKNLSFVIAEKISRKGLGRPWNWDYTENLSRRHRMLCEKFADFQYDNVGLKNGKLIMLDAGCGFAK